MTPTTEPTSPQAPAPADTDVVAAVQRVLRESPEPLTVPKIRSKLPAPFRSITPEELEDVLRRQVAANVLQPYPKYRSPHDRFWDRPMADHVAALVRNALAEGALGWSELRRKLPAYAQPQAETVLGELTARGEVYRYPRTGRGAERYGVRPPDPKDYLRSELAAVFQRLEGLGFSLNQLRAGALELLHDEEWDLRPARPETVPAGGEGPASSEAPTEAIAGQVPAAAGTEPGQPT